MKRLFLLATLATASAARADTTGTLPGGAMITFNRLFLHEHNVANQQLPITTPTSQWTYFNLAHCVCSQPNASQITPWYEGKFAYEIKLQGQTSLIHAPLEIWVGSNCNDTVMRGLNCHRIDGAGVTDMSTIGVAAIDPEVSVYELMEPEPNSAGCDSRTLSAAEWAISNVNPDGSIGGTPQYFVSQAIATDALAPWTLNGTPVPASFTASGAENAIDISWSASTGGASDIAYYQALCSDSSGSPGKAKPPAARYETARNLCGASQDATLMPKDISGATGNPDGGSIALPQGLSELDPSYLCGEATDPTATNLRIDGLRNGEAYTVVLLAIDKFGNAGGVYFTSTLTPKPVTDFWEDLHSRGSKVEGGYCLIADTYGDDSPLTQGLRGFRDDELGGSRLGRWLAEAYYAHVAPLGELVRGHPVLRVIAGIVLLPVVAFALAWHLLTLPGLIAVLALIALRRRVKRWLERLPRRLVLAATAAGALLVLPTAAHAQQPYWSDPLAKDSKDDAASLADQELDVTWHVGIKVGPYIPQIDAQLGGTKPGPYRQMFGSSPAWMPLLDVDRVILRGYGQLTVGLTLGYMSRTAHAFVDGSSPTDPNRPRSPGDKTSFRMIPTALTVGYRLTTLDDEYGVPVVPYLRGGLSYYVWWVNAPSGDFATVNGMNKADGASLGVQGALGLAIRAERIDSDAARSMRDGGIEHAGFYAEIQAAKVDGFGSSKKLAVGDTTWFAGVDFEF